MLLENFFCIAVNKHSLLPQIGIHDAGLPGTCTWAVIVAHSKVMSHLMCQSGTYSYGSCVIVLRDMREHMDTEHMPVSVIHVYEVNILFLLPGWLR